MLKFAYSGLFECKIAYSWLKSRTQLFGQAHGSFILHLLPGPRPGFARLARAVASLRLYGRPRFQKVAQAYLARAAAATVKLSVPCPGPGRSAASAVLAAARQA